ncbi:MAG: hypothetical protein HRU12_09990, partial [Phaeodactylibacter sp.]|nr:hypothetical protein [Phaeodactylibacter sp.]
MTGQSSYQECLNNFIAKVPLVVESFFKKTKFLTNCVEFSSKTIFMNPKILVPHLPNLLLSTLFIAIMARVAIPVPEALGGIPITGQSLAVVLVGLLLPFPWGGVAVLLYL